MSALLLFLLACHDEPEPCGDLRALDDTECPCTTTVYSLTRWSAATCRPDQTARIEWEPTNGPRFENEDRVGGVLICECVPQTQQPQGRP